MFSIFSYVAHTVSLGYLWFEFVGSLLCLYRQVFSGYSSFRSPQKLTIDLIYVNYS